MIYRCVQCEAVGWINPPCSCEDAIKVVPDYRPVWAVFGPHFWLLLVGKKPTQWVRENLPEKDGPYKVQMATRDDILVYKLSGCILRTTELPENYGLVDTLAF